MSRTGRRQRRSCAPWALCLAILAISSASGFCRPMDDTSAPGGLPPASSTSPRKTLDQEIGSPSELAWQAWLLVENKSGGQGGSALDSSNILRRITPKSIFIAPELVSCPSGYSPDGKGVCKPDPIDFNEDAQKIFLLKRLNALYGKGGSNRKKPEASGPLQINIPISLPAKGSPPEGQPVQPQSEQQAASQSSQAPASTQEVPQSSGHKVEVTGSVDRVAIPVVISQHVPLNDNNKSQDAVAVVIYNVANDTKKEQKSSDEGVKTSFFLGTANTSGAKKDRPQSSHVVPVAEIVDEMNETFSGVVDYKIPLSLKTVFNASRLPEKKDQSDSSEDMSPTMVLLLSPTKVPFTTTSQPDTEPSKMVSYSQSSQNRDTEEIDSTTVQTTEEETKSDTDTTIQTVAPLSSQKPVEPVTSTARSTDRFSEKPYTQDKLEDESMYADEESQTEAESDDHEDYETTDEADQDDFGDSEDEILKPGEAGMTIPSKNRDLVKTKNHKHHLSTIPDAEDLTSTTITDATTTPAFTTINLQDTFDASDSTAKTGATDSTKETVMTTETTEVPSTIMTTEPSTEETTLYTTKLVRSDSWMKTTTRRSPTTIPVTTTIDDREKTETQGYFETERDLVTEPEVIFSTQGSHSMTTAFGRRKPAQPAKIVDVPYTIAEFEEVVTRTEPPPVLDYHRRDPTDRQRPSLTVNDEPVIFKSDDSLPSEFRDQMADSSRPSSSDFRVIPSHLNDESSTYVRFPEHLSDVRSQPGGFVRFPSDEVNSIHNQDNFKDHLLSAYRTREDYAGNVSPTSTKSSVPARQKPPSSHWRIPPPGVRTDRQQQQQQLQAGPSGQRQQKQKPMLLRFWARMPLVRDLSFYPTTSHGSHNEPIGGPDGQRRGNGARRAGHYKEMSSHEVSRLLAQQLGG